ncbi:MAG: hypothetical protein KGN02_14330, partial [bacterium]|nr:hypothetical protein [bacterium]
LRKWEMERIKALDYPFRLSPSAPEVVREGRRRLILMIAEERVGYAHRSEAYLKAISANLRALVRLEKDYRDRVDLRFDKAFTPMRRIALPNVA